MGATAIKHPRLGAAAAHYGLLDERCFEVVARALAELESRNIDYVLAGGWAVYAYGSTVPSVDTDVFLHAQDEASVTNVIAELGIAVGTGRQFEPLDMDAPNQILGPDVDMQEPERGYVPEMILKNRRTKRSLNLGKHGVVTAAVPNAGALLFMKLKAYHDRELSWSALRDAAVMANRIPTADRAQVREMTDTHYYRKAGKDIYDIALLATRHNALPEGLAIARETGLHEDLEPLTRRIQEPLRAFALDMAAYENDEPTGAWLRALDRA